MLPAITPDELHLLVFGPGTGELVVVCAPPGRWLMIDGCGVGALRYGINLLKHHGVRPSLIAFTHPHLDHASGVAEVIDHATHGVLQAEWPKIGLVWPTPRHAGTWSDLQGQFEAGQVERALAATRDRWEREPRTRWPLLAGGSTPLGDATVSVLSPTAATANSAFAAWRAHKRWDANRIATALEVKWRGHRLLLGSDLVEKPGQGWTEILRQARTSPGHAATKVPHHGSVGAIHEVWIRPAGTEPLLVVTPFARQNLPRFHQQGGIAKMLQHARQVHLTGLPRAHSAQSARPARRRRSALAGLGKAVLDPVTPGWPDCFVAATVAASGAVRLVHGPGSLTVIPP